MFPLKQHNINQCIEEGKTHNITNSCYISAPPIAVEVKKKKRTDGRVSKGGEGVGSANLRCPPGRLDFYLNCRHSKGSTPEA